MTYAQAARDIMAMLDARKEDRSLQDDEIIANIEALIRAAWEVEEKPRDVLHISSDQAGQSHRIRIGTAFSNRDGSLNAYLDLLPRDGKMQIRVRESGDAK